MIVINQLPEAFALLFITAGIAMIIVALAGKVVFKDIEFGFLPFFRQDTRHSTFIW